MPLKVSSKYSFDSLYENRCWDLSTCVALPKVDSSALLACYSAPRQQDCAYGARSQAEKIFILIRCCAAGLCKWVGAMVMYHEAAKIVKPKMDYLTVQTARCGL